MEQFARYWANHTAVPANHPALLSYVAPVLIASTPLWSGVEQGAVGYGGVVSIPQAGGARVSATLYSTYQTVDNRFYGGASVSLDLGSIPAYLRSIRGTPNTQIFAYDNTGYLIGTTMTKPFRTQFAINASYVAGPGCSSSLSFSEVANGVMVATCREHISDYGVAPLAHIARDTASAFPADDRVA